MLSVSGSLASTVGVKNPIRYRGYYYDTETELYFLGSRYYDPEVGRWINSDDVNVAVGAGQYNLYSYCGGDPVNRVDPTGCAWYNPSSWSNKTKIIVGAAFIVAGIVATIATGGAAVPAVIATVKAVAVSVAISSGIGAVTEGIERVVDGGSFWDGALDGAKQGAVDGFMWGGIFAGGAQILSGGFRIAANLGARTGPKGGIPLGKNVKILSPNNVKHFENGGTLFKIGNLTRNGKNIRLDVGAESLLHINIQLGKNFHFFIGKYIAGIIGGF